MASQNYFSLLEESFIQSLFTEFENIQKSLILQY